MARDPQGLENQGRAQAAGRAVQTERKVDEAPEGLNQDPLVDIVTILETVMEGMPPEKAKLVSQALELLRQASTAKPQSSAEIVASPERV